MIIYSPGARPATTRTMIIYSGLDTTRLSVYDGHMTSQPTASQPVSLGRGAVVFYSVAVVCGLVLSTRLAIHQHWHTMIIMLLLTMPSAARLWANQHRGKS